MILDTIFSQTQKDDAYRIISKIDSDEGRMFNDNVNKNYFKQKFFEDSNNYGVFFSFLFNGKLRVHIAFEEDTDKYLDEITELLTYSIEKSGGFPIYVWLRNENTKIINGLQQNITFNPQGVNNSHYASTEFIVKRENFKASSNDHGLTVKAYDDHYIYDYLALLDSAMSFENPPPSYARQREKFHSYFSGLKEKNAFEAFWKDDDLVGLYWLQGSTLDKLAIKPKYQRKGYGTAILSRALEVAFDKPDTNRVQIFCADWNSTGHDFYIKYGCEIVGHSYTLAIG